mgnify:CR=1 FL=1
MGNDRKNRADQCEKQSGQKSLPLVPWGTNQGHDLVALTYDHLEDFGLNKTVNESTGERRLGER